MVDIMKLKALKENLSELKSVMLAYSGGVDSTFLLKIAKDVLGDNMVAVTATSVIYPSFEIQEAIDMAKKFSVKHIIVENYALENDKFIKNPPERCYWCKKELFSRLNEMAHEKGFNCVIDGTNADDTNDFRPGMRATAELGIRSPLKDIGLTKAEIRKFSKEAGIPTWDKPSYACLASRFPYGTVITEDNLTKVGQAEEFLRNYGFKQLRVRHYGETAKIELLEDDLGAVLKKNTRQEIITFFNELGYTYVTLDLKGYRTGSLNEVL
jgi:uncharacterized protein